MLAAIMIPDDVTQLLQAVRGGDGHAWDQLFARVYDELHALAERFRRRERSNHTLQTTALVNEAFLRLVNERDRSWRNRTHFLAIAATCMRRVLVHYAEKRATLKRGGAVETLGLDGVLELFESRGENLLALDDVLSRLAAEDARKARVIEMHFFGGLEFKEIADVLGVSTRTVERDWRLAKAWIRAELDGDHS
jgi:RNA polymerase sigma factor (TIGR02999 family)